MCIRRRNSATCPWRSRSASGMNGGRMGAGALPVWIRVQFGMSQRPAKRKSPTRRTGRGLNQLLSQAANPAQTGLVLMLMLTDGAQYATEKP